MCSVHREGLGELSRPGTQIDRTYPPSSLRHAIESLQRLDRTKEDGAAFSLTSGHHVHHVVIAVREEHIQMAGLSEHHLVASGRATGSVTRGISGFVGLGLHDAPRHASAV